MTHEYTLLVGATVLPGGATPPCRALAWAAGTILALGTEAEIRAMSRGDSHVMALPGRFVAPLGEPLEIGGPADLLVLATDPRLRGVEPGAGGEEWAQSGPRRVAVIRGGHVVEGSVDAPRDGSAPAS
jgi:hypothetical protein